MSVQKRMLIKTYICPGVQSERSAEKVMSCLVSVPIQGIDINPDQHAVRVGLLQESDDALVKECLCNAGFPPEEITEQIQDADDC